MTSWTGYGASDSTFKCSYLLYPMRNNVLIFIYNLTLNYITLNSLDVLLGRKLVFEEESFGESFLDHALSPLPLLSTLNVCVDLSQHPPSACANLVNLGPAYSCFRFALHTACILLVHHLQLPPALWEVKVWVQIQGRPSRSRSTMNTRDTNMSCLIHTLDTYWCIMDTYCLKILHGHYFILTQDGCDCLWRSCLDKQCNYNNTTSMEEPY